ncbi:hypothetical protein FRC00_012993 [Tulasnella sp. 408]|nr:hypothetical protein FRC00_012993 [Tulasnella sp. 408]
MSLLQVDPNRRPTATQALQDKWLTELTAASSEIDIGEGLRTNFDPKAKWKSAIFKVRINNSLAKLNRTEETPVKDGRTTSDEEDSDSDDEVSIFSVKKKDSGNPTAASVGSTSSKSVPEESGEEEEAKAKEPEKAKEAVATPASPPPSAAVQPQTSANGVTPTETPKRPGAHPSQQQHHHHHDDSDDEGPSMPGSFHFGSPKKGGRPITPDGRSGVEVITEKLRGLGWK